MILQCDQCNTKFKLDDAKIKEGGVKVRCSKCKHVFLVTKDVQEETDFDSILDGLDAPPSPPAATAGATTGTAAAADAPDVAMPQVNFSHLKQAIQATDANETEKDDEPTAEAFDFSSFKFDDDQQEPATDAGSNEKSYDLSGFEPDEEENIAADIQEGAAVATSGEPPVEEESRFEMSEFTFDEVPASEPTSDVNAAESPAEPPGFNDFSFNEEPLAAPAPEAEPTPPGEFDFSEFSFDAGETKHEETTSAEVNGSATDTGLDFGSFDFQEEEPAKEQLDPVGMPDLAAAADEPFASPSLEFDLMAEAEPEQAPTAISTPPAPEAESTGDFSFDFGTPEEPAPEAAPPLEQPPNDHTGEADIPEFSFGDFTEQEPTEPVPDKPAADLPAMELARNDGAPELETIDFGEVAAASAVPAAEEHNPEPLFDGAVGVAAKDEMPPAVVSEADFHEDYPPLSIASRRKGSSFFSSAGIGAVILVLLASAGTGIFLLKSKPEVFGKLGLGSMAQGLGGKSAEDGRISVKNPVGSFLVNKEAGELFVITGSAVNEYKKPRASIQVKASLFGKDGKPVMQKVVYCGNNLSREQIVSMPLDKLETAMNNQFGDSLSNLGVQPGKEIPFVVILNKVPQDVAEFGVEVVGSTVAGQ